ncbi:MAG: flagellar filament capping protein FliD [Lachnospiraceae bacterium]
MAGINGSTGLGTSGIRGYGGLASGLDRDALIEKMTLGTKTKISVQKQKRQSKLWQQEAYRSISSKLIAFSQKYTSYTSSTNLTSSSFFSRSKITASGVNSKYIDVTGATKGGVGFSIVGVKQLATDASTVSKTPASDQILTSGSISTDITATQNVSNLEGQVLSIKYGNDTYSVPMRSGTTSDGYTYDYSTPEKAAEAMNKSLETVAVSGGKKMSDIMEVQTDATGKFIFKAKDTAGNDLELGMQGDKVFKALGIIKEGQTHLDIPEGSLNITTEGLKATNAPALTHPETFAERVAGNGMSFTYNGVTKTIKITDKITSLEDVQKSLQEGLNSAFGKGRITVSLDKNAGNTAATFGFKTTKPNGEQDLSSVLAISDGDKGVLGKTGAFGIVAGESNRLNLEASLADVGLKGFHIPAGKKPEDALSLTINGTEIKGLTYKSTMNEVMDKINTTVGANVNIAYLHNSDKFVIKSTQNGAGGSVSFGGSDAEMLFGKEGTDYDVTKGQDAIISIKYEGTEDVLDITRGTNTFKLDGLNITAKQEFGYDKTIVNGQPVYTEKVDNEAVKFTASVDSEKVVNAIKDMVKDYNEMLELVNKEVRQKPDRNYQPLTEEQKAGLSADQIKTYEEKAKQGMLFNDTAIRSLADEMRFLVTGNSTERKALEGMGITVGTNYEDNGKIVLDETKLKAALESDPERVQNAFSRQADEATGDKGGLMTRVSKVMDKYASTSGAIKGILVERAGSPSAPTSILKNALLKEMNSIDQYITKLQAQLESETDRYISQFTNLETVISQMNAQSSWLQSQ